MSDERSRNTRKLAASSSSDSKKKQKLDVSSETLDSDETASIHTSESYDSSFVDKEDDACFDDADYVPPTRLGNSEDYSSEDQEMYEHVLYDGDTACCTDKNVSGVLFGVVVVKCGGARAVSASKAGEGFNMAIFKRMDEEFIKEDNVVMNSLIPSTNAVLNAAKCISGIMYDAMDKEAASEFDGVVVWDVIVNLSVFLKGERHASRVATRNIFIPYLGDMPKLLTENKRKLGDSIVKAVDDFPFVDSATS